MKKRSLVAGVVLLLACTSASAQDDPRKAQAQAIFGDGLKEHDGGHEEAALAKFEDAYRIYPSPNVLFNIGREQQLLGRNLEAIRNYRACIGDPLLNPSNASLASTYIRELQTKLGRIEITAPKDAQVEIDGVLQTGGSPYDVQPGDHKVTVTAKSGKKAEKSCHLETGDAIGMDVSKELGGDLAPQIGGPEKPADDKQWFPPPTGAIIVGGVGIVGLGLGVGFGLSSMSAHDSAQTMAASHPCSVPSSQACHDLEDKNSSVSSMSTLSIVSYIAGGALVAGGVVWWLVAPRHKSGSEIGITPAVGPKNAGLGLHGSF
ncbi:MAG TPA: hypothetical protein VF407_18300 [Polyangiaceae bacterium]